VRGQVTNAFDARKYMVRGAVRMSKLKVIVIGAGIIGAASAFELASLGADVLMLDGGDARATEGSFGWINASFFENSEYHALRVEGIAAYHRLQKRLDVPVRWTGGLCWEFAGDAFDAQFEALLSEGYNSETLDRAAIAALEPALGVVPERAIRFAAEGVAEPAAIAERFLEAAIALGAKVARGFHVQGFLQNAGQICGVRTEQGVFEADRVLVAAGTGTEALLKDVGIALPMLHRPALVLTTKPVAWRLNHVLATDFGEVRQLPNGALMTPAAIGHQGDSAADLDAHPDVAAERSMTRLRALFPEADLQLGAMHLAHRPIPKDGFPAVGEVAPGLYAATLHSGITLAALMGELIGQEILHGVSDDTARWLAPYRPARFV
jgi:glycine/D-amino acid oxidase-like deaminating enzyme